MIRLGQFCGCENPELAVKAPRPPKEANYLFFFSIMSALSRLACAISDEKNQRA